MSSAKTVKGFSLYPSYREFLALLSDTDRGQLLMCLFDYYDGVNSSSALSPQAQMAFTFISTRMEQDKGRAAHRSQINRENAAKRWPRQSEEEGDGEGG
ncbi:MAG: hypothetical protein IJC29_01355 [Clostridia bacterium]|nr:hypothetical protein [Clostridia bacterium]